MKKRYAAMLAVLVLGAAVAYCAVPRAIVHEGYPISWVVRHRTEQTEDVTDQMDLDAVWDLVSQYSRSAVPRPFPKLKSHAGTVQLAAGDEHGPWHIYLSNGEGTRNGKPFYMAYRGDGWGGYPIRDGEELMEALLELMPA